MFNKVREQLNNKMRQWSMEYQPQSWIITTSGHGLIIDADYMVMFVDPETGKLMFAEEIEAKSV